SSRGLRRLRAGRPVTNPGQPVVQFAGLSSLNTGVQAAERKPMTRDDRGRARSTRFEERWWGAIKPDISLPRTTRGRSPLRRTAQDGSVGSQTEKTLWKRNPPQSGRHLVTMASTRRRFFSRKPVWDLAGILRKGQQAGELTIMPPPIDPSRDLLFGLLALQNG